MTFTCPRCGRRSQNPTDESEGYCAECQAFTGAEPTRYGQLPALNMAELRDLAAAVQSRRAVLGPPGNETLASLTSLSTAIAEAMTGARPLNGLAVIADLRRSLAGMPADQDGARRAAREMLDAMEVMVRDLHGYQERAELADIAGGGGVFWCHQGMRKPTAFRHPDLGITVATTTDGYDPPIIADVPYRADGTPGQRCAGWDAMRRALGGVVEQAADD